jgi:hypothetical protein
MLDKYRRMLAKVNEESIVIWQMNTEQALSILNA